jgi:hypothetical protein
MKSFGVEARVISRDDEGLDEPGLPFKCGGDEVFVVGVDAEPSWLARLCEGSHCELDQPRAYG